VVGDVGGSTVGRGTVAAVGVGVAGGDAAAWTMDEDTGPADTVTAEAEVVAAAFGVVVGEPV
jgi:hypothetical protein